MMDQMRDVISLHGDERSLGSRNSLGSRRSTRSSRSNKSSNRQRSRSKSTNAITGRQIRVNLIPSGGNGEQRLPPAHRGSSTGISRGNSFTSPKNSSPHHIQQQHQQEQQPSQSNSEYDKTSSQQSNVRNGEIRIIAIASTISMLMMKCQLHLFLPVGTKTIITAGMDDKYRVSHRGETGATPR